MNDDRFDLNDALERFREERARQRRIFLSISGTRNWFLVRSAVSAAARAHGWRHYWSEERGEGVWLDEDGEERSAPIYQLAIGLAPEWLVESAMAVIRESQKGEFEDV